MSTTQKAKRLHDPAWVACLKDLTVNPAVCFFFYLLRALSLFSITLIPTSPLFLFPIPLSAFFHLAFTSSFLVFSWCSLLFSTEEQTESFFFLSCTKIIVCNKRVLECQTARKQENTGKCGSVEFTSTLTVAFQHVAKCLSGQNFNG